MASIHETCLHLLHGCKIRTRRKAHLKGLWPQTKYLPNRYGPDPQIHQRKESLERAKVLCIYFKQEGLVSLSSSAFPVMLSCVRMIGSYFITHSTTSTRRVCAPTFDVMAFCASPAVASSTLRTGSDSITSSTKMFITFQRASGAIFAHVLSPRSLRMLLSGCNAAQGQSQEQIDDFPCN